jgi:hypothetical protein
MAPKSPTSIRAYASAFALVLGLLSVWLIAAEATRPKLPFFPKNGAEAKASTMHRSVAATAAWIGWPRGGLWVDYAITINAALLANFEDGITDKADHPAQNAFAASETAARLDPSDARVWLLLASANEQSASNSSRALAQLKMSYYTSPYSEHLFPLRIQIVARSTAPFDDELSSFIDYELGMIVRDEPALKQTIGLAFRSASPAGRQFLAASMGKHDQKFLSKLKAANP